MMRERERERETDRNQERESKRIDLPDLYQLVVIIQRYIIKSNVCVMIIWCAIVEASPPPEKNEVYKNTREQISL